jgi:hypothetical protein
VGSVRSTYMRVGFQYAISFWLPFSAIVIIWREREGAQWSEVSVSQSSEDAYHTAAYT